MKKMLIILVCVICFNGCMYQAELRPVHDTSLIWICEEPYAEFKFVKEKSMPKGRIIYNEKRYNVAYDVNYGAGMYIMSGDILKSENEDAYWHDFLCAMGRAEYKRDGFDFQIEEDYVNMFNGELPLLKFKCYKKADYFKEKQDE